jgi:hypothetical protein
MTNAICHDVNMIIRDIRHSLRLSQAKRVHRI